MMTAKELAEVTSSAVRAIVDRRGWVAGEVIAVVLEDSSITIVVCHVSAMLGALKSDELRAWFTAEARHRNGIPVLYSAPEAFSRGLFKKGGV